MESPLPDKVRKIQNTVVRMYSEHPWPLNRNADEEMGWRLKCLGVVEEDYKNKFVFDMGCGTGEYAFWYSMNGARKVVGIDLSEGSLEIAQRRQEQLKLKNIEFLKMDALNCEFPDNFFDYSFSVGVLHHTGDPFRGFEQLVRVTKPGGIIIVSLYNIYSRRILRLKQTICKWLGGNNIDKRVEWGQKLFFGTLRKLDRRYHGLNTDAIAYDIFGFPHESLHSAQEVLGWLDKTNVEYKGSFAPLRLTDYFYAFAQSEYESFRVTFDGFPIMDAVGSLMVRFAKFQKVSKDSVMKFKRPSLFSCWMCQTLWLFFGLRFNCFTISGTKTSK